MAKSLAELKSKDTILLTESHNEVGYQDSYAQ